MIRIHNTTEFDFTDVKVGGETYESISAGSYTEYRDFGLAYPAADLMAYVDGDMYKGGRIIDLQGVKPLAPGYVTFELYFPKLPPELVAERKKLGAEKWTSLGLPDIQERMIAMRINRDVPPSNATK